MHSVWIDSKDVPAREQSAKMEISGLFAGARVVRGMDWSWGDQDGNDNDIIVTDCFFHNKCWKKHTHTHTTI